MPNKAKFLPTLLADIPGHVHQLIADRAYDTAANRGRLDASGIDTVIPRIRRKGYPVASDFDLIAYGARHLIEDSFRPPQTVPRHRHPLLQTGRHLRRAGVTGLLGTSTPAEVSYTV